MGALKALLRKKTRHYGRLVAADFRLIAFYNLGHRYNTPFIGVRLRSLGDVAKIAHDALSEMSVPLTRVYLLDLPAREAFEAYPAVVWCE